jgi:hypothetical protein
MVENYWMWTHHVYMSFSYTNNFFTKNYENIHTYSFYPNPPMYFLRLQMFVMFDFYLNFNHLFY